MAGCSPASGFVAFLPLAAARVMSPRFSIRMKNLYVRKTICAPRFFRLWTKARAVTKTLLSDASLPNFQAVMLLRHLMRSDNCSHQVLPGFLLVLDCDCTFSATA
ncbi:hypothetical protein TGME49_244165 [Toxoplasma gondii ME49]|uniref:Secreted protein n=2 Tax=Toxoplasma gondii TaxID=5811 RepID=A0A2G8Y6C4_TOXGO|nr:hypothetical protein TGME49_244165 [Toxoplasma gondii ME49]EPT30538.1 hypothetical protein TGME49_244165 [Toxoplasma gondii ME49]PIM02810.1 hypothetical protein TGCOUG_244165 [Toxoplasma gondii COUG]|eukprot:XP_018637539.1 hypothetical protein TGME49_244165 [Toxoplasma gondii ME49]